MYQLNAETNIMKANDYIIYNRKNKVFPFGVEFYIYVNRKPYIDYMGFENVKEAINFIKDSGLTFLKQN